MTQPQASVCECLHYYCKVHVYSLCRVCYVKCVHPFVCLIKHTPALCPPALCPVCYNDIINLSSSFGSTIILVFNVKGLAWNSDV